MRWPRPPAASSSAAPFDLGPALTPVPQDEEPQESQEVEERDDAPDSFLERAEKTTGVPVEGAASVLGAVALLLGVGLALRARRRRMRPPWL